jgi:hypothetical protein
MRESIIRVAQLALILAPIFSVGALFLSIVSHDRHRNGRLSATCIVTIFMDPRTANLQLDPLSVIPYG